MNLFVFHLLFIPSVGFVLGLLLWQKKFKDAAVYTVLVAVGYLLWVMAAVNRQIIISQYLVEFFDALRGWWR